MLVKLFEGLFVYYITINMPKAKKILKFWLVVLFFLNSCVSLPGINKSPSKKNQIKKLLKVNTQLKMLVSILLTLINCQR